MAVRMLENFEAADVYTGETRIFARRSGSGPPILLLHGFPQTHLMWRSVAPLLARRFTVVCADLRGYGRSACPASTPDHTPYSKRAMARDMVTVMERLGFPRFSVTGHDRGGRVAYRLALDHPRRVDRIAVLDVLPTGEVWERADARFALAFWPWSLLASPNRSLSVSWQRHPKPSLTTLSTVGAPPQKFSRRRFGQRTSRRCATRPACMPSLKSIVRQRPAPASTMRQTAEADGASPALSWRFGADWDR
jgi:pimeloyl-ACP methyl ester carboxylesterase